MQKIQWTGVSQKEQDMDFFPESSPHKLFEWSSFPKLDVYETQNEIIVKSYIGGISRENILIDIGQGHIKLSIKDGEGNNRIRNRTIPLHTRLMCEQSRLLYEEDLLTIMVPKMGVEY
ncbi:MAG: Hsp20/alpha crystallin family protein [Clostridia bacterium]|nr:Hsp20/alpha crystallin family protein [Clostridia bacterium]